MGAKKGEHRHGSISAEAIALFRCDFAECGGFILTDVREVDTSIAVDMLRVFALLAGCHQYPDTMG